MSFYLNSRRRYPRTLCYLLVLINPKLSELTQGSLCHWFDKNLSSRNFDTQNTLPVLNLQS